MNEIITVMANTSNSIASDIKLFCKLLWYWVNDICILYQDYVMSQSNLHLVPIVITTE